MTMFMGEQVRRDEPRLEVLRRHFQQNLEDIIALGAGAGARVVVSTMVSNLKDWPPFGSLHRVGLTEAQRLEWDKHYQLGAAAEQAGDVQGAIRSYAQAAQLDNEFAELHFRWGGCCLAAGQPEAARTHFVLARDLDTLRFRTDSRLNELIRRTVAAQTGRGVRLVDAEKEFNRHSRQGIPGEEWLHEHVHFTFAGNYLLARLFAEELAGWFPPSITARAASRQDWPSAEVCAARLGFTDTQRYEITRLLERRFAEPIYRQQLGHAERYERLLQELAGLRAAAKPVARHRAVEACRQASAGAPDDWTLHELTARLLGGLDDYAAAESEWRQVNRLIPHAARPYSEIGKLQQQQGKANEARAAFGKALELNPDWVDAHVGLGAVCSQQGKHSEASRHFRNALRLDPTRREAEEGLRKPAFDSTPRLPPAPSGS
jgi:tetratricopeptide (TPR) repeat protein